MAFKLPTGDWLKTTSRGVTAVDILVDVALPIEIGVQIDELDAQLGHGNKIGQHEAL